MEWNRNLCPFYISDNRRSIRCKSPAGMIAEMVTEFEQAEKKDEYIQRYCESCEGHIHCPQYRINLLIWEEMSENEESHFESFRFRT